jgi:predicted ester cyclase
VRDREGLGRRSEHCHSDATFSAQADALAGVDTLQGYADWMAGLLTPVPDGDYEIRSFAADEDRGNVSAYAVFRGTHTGEGGPVPPSGKSVEADYVYVMDFDGDRIRHMTKIWNDGISLRQLGWG